MKSTTMALITGVLLCALLLGKVDMIKFSKGSAPPPPPPSPPQNPEPAPQPPSQPSQSSEQYLASPPLILPQTRGAYQPRPLYYQAPPITTYRNERYLHFDATSNGQRLPLEYYRTSPLVSSPAPLLAPPQAYAYLIVRPLHTAPYQYQHYQYQQPSRYIYGVQPPAYYRQNEQSDASGTKGGSGTKSPQQEEITQQMEVLDQQQQEPGSEVHPGPQPQPQPQPQNIKEGKIKAMLDKLLSKFSLGSSYEVAGEEVYPPPVVIIPPSSNGGQQPQPGKDSPPQQQHIDEQQIEQQRDIGFQQEESKGQQQYQQQELVQQVQLQQQQVDLAPIRQDPAKGETFKQEEQSTKQARKTRIERPLIIQQQQSPQLTQEPLRQGAEQSAGTKSSSNGL